MKTLQLYNKLNGVIPASLCCEWDNDGLSVNPSPEHESKRILVSLDVRSEVISYAERNGFDTVVTHHPLIFDPLKELCGKTVVSEKALRLIRADIAAMSFHTRFDALPGGVSDALCDALGLKPFMSFGEQNCARLCKVELGFDELAAKAAELFGRSHFFAEKATENASVAAVCGGSAGDFIPEAKQLGADVFICGETGYHTAIDAADDGMNIICVGHYESEFPALSRLGQIVAEQSGAYVELYGVSLYAL